MSSKLVSKCQSNGVGFDFPGKEYLKQAVAMSGQILPGNLVLGIKLKGEYDLLKSSDQSLKANMLRYYAQLELDDIPLWTEEEITYYQENQVGQSLDRGH